MTKFIVILYTQINGNFCGRDRIELVEFFGIRSIVDVVCQLFSIMMYNSLDSWLDLGIIL